MNDDDESCSSLGSPSLIDHLPGNERLPGVGDHISSAVNMVADESSQPYPLSDEADIATLENISLTLGETEDTATSDTQSERDSGVCNIIYYT